jgi:hypothetical protein
LLFGDAIGLLFASEVRLTTETGLATNEESKGDGGEVECCFHRDVWFCVVRLPIHAERGMKRDHSN